MSESLAHACMKDYQSPQGTSSIFRKVQDVRHRALGLCPPQSPPKQDCIITDVGSPSSFVRRLSDGGLLEFAGQSILE
ncbi:hypothetical protein B0O80DRAFT_168232 [Mortierella sp. GBAus27b]|nr:hypothetical protein B0O80DRAFT_168232 [Mortierella sp. GBAus27b]